MNKIGLLLVAVLMLSACGESESDKDSSENAGADAKGYCSLGFVMQSDTINAAANGLSLSMALSQALADLSETPPDVSQSPTDRENIVREAEEVKKFCDEFYAEYAEDFTCKANVEGHYRKVSAYHLKDECETAERVLTEYQLNEP